jgi:hypothetical protein
MACEIANLRLGNLQLQDEVESVKEDIKQMIERSQSELRQELRQNRASKTSTVEPKQEPKVMEHHPSRFETIDIEINETYGAVE